MELTGNIVLGILLALTTSISILSIINIIENNTDFEIEESKTYKECIQINSFVFNEKSIKTKCLEEYQKRFLLKMEK